MKKTITVTGESHICKKCVEEEVKILRENQFTSLGLEILLIKEQEKIIVESPLEIVKAQYKKYLEIHAPLFSEAKEMNVKIYPIGCPIREGPWEIHEKKLAKVIEKRKRKFGKNPAIIVGCEDISDGLSNYLPFKTIEVQIHYHHD